MILKEIKKVIKLLKVFSMFIAAISSLLGALVAPYYIVGFIIHAFTMLSLKMLFYSLLSILLFIISAVIFLIVFQKLVEVKLND